MANEVWADEANALTGYCIKNKKVPELSAIVTKFTTVDQDIKNRLLSLYMTR